MKESLECQSRRKRSGHGVGVDIDSQQLGRFFDSEKSYKLVNRLIPYVFRRY